MCSDLALVHAASVARGRAASATVRRAAFTTGTSIIFPSSWQAPPCACSNAATIR
jgi:hypothetical protein